MRRSLQIRGMNKFLEYVKCMGAVIRGISWRKPHVECSGREPVYPENLRRFREVPPGKVCRQLHSKPKPSILVLLYSAPNGNHRGPGNEENQQHEGNTWKRAKKKKKKNLTPGEIILKTEDCFKFVKEFSGRVGKIIYSKTGVLRTGVGS